MPSCNSERELLDEALVEMTTVCKVDKHRTEAVSHLVVLLSKLVEEEVCKVLDAGVGVLQAQGHARNVALHLHHVIHDQVGQHHQAVFAHACDRTDAVHCNIVFCSRRSFRCAFWAAHDPASIGCSDAFLH